MSTQPEQVNGLITAVNALKSYFEGVRASIDVKITEMRTSVAGYISAARGEAPFYRLTKNQALSGTSGTIPAHWVSGRNATYTLIQSVNSNVEWADRTAEEQELLTALGRTGVKYIYQNFNIWKVEWTTAAPDSYLMYQQTNATIESTVGAMVKILSGACNGSWAEGATNQWGLCGKHSVPENLDYAHYHPYRQTPTGAMLFALPAVVAGHVPLDANMWGGFPYIGDEQND